MRKTMVASFLMVCFIFSLIGTTQADELAHADELAVVGATAYAETLQEGQTVVGVRIEYPGEIASSSLTFTTFKVHGYDIIGYYVNNSGEWDEAANNGKYVFLKLGVNQVPGYTQGKTLQYFNSGNLRMPITLEIWQNSRITLLDGNVVNPSVFTNTAEVNLLVDDFLALTYTDSTGFEVKYRLFVPEGYETKKDDLENLPLVVFYHGGGEGGINNDVQIMGNPSALEFAKPEAQAKHPSFVMAPQSITFPSTGGSWATNVGTAKKPVFTETASLHAAIESLYNVMETYNVDPNRIYGTGLSQGSRGTWTSSMMHPDLYAAQLNVASADIYSDEELMPIVNKPIWTFVAIDDQESRVTNTNNVVNQLGSLGAVVNRKTGEDSFNGFLRGFAANQQAQEQWDEAKEQGATLMLTNFVAGTVKPDAHFSWMYIYNNEVIRDWLFSQSK